MATPSPYPLFLTQALHETAAKVARQYDLLMSLEPSSGKPYHLHVRLKNSPQKKSFEFETAQDVQSFLKQMAEMA